MNSGTWLGLLGDVTQLQIPIELVTNNQNTPWTDIECIDNVTLTGSATGTPEPASLSLVFAGSGMLGLAWLRRRRTP